MKNTITLLLLLFLSVTAFSQERLIKIINDGGGPGPTNWKTITSQQYTYYPQGEVKTILDSQYDTTGVTIYLSTLRRYYYNNNGQVDSMAQFRIIPQTADTSLSGSAKYFYTNQLLDSTAGLSYYNGLATERGANKYLYQNGFQTSYLQYGYDSGYGYFLSHKEDYLYDINNNRVNEMHYWGYLDLDLNYSFNDSLYVRLDHYYSNVSRKDSTAESAMETNPVSQIVELSPRYKTFFKYNQTDSLARTEKSQFSWTIPGQYEWQPPLVNNYVYDNNNFLDKWNMYNIADSLQGSINTCAKYYRSNNGRLDSIYGGHSLVPGGIDLNINDYLGRTIYVYSTDEGEILFTPNNEATNITIYPNPFNQFITIETDNADKKQVLVFDMNGKVISNQTTADKKYVFDARALPAGVYMVSVATNKGTVVKTLVKGQ